MFLICLVCCIFYICIHSVIRISIGCYCYGFEESLDVHVLKRFDSMWETKVRSAVKWGETKIIKTRDYNEASIQQHCKKINGQI